jgi:hypothetical protein
MLTATMKRRPTLPGEMLLEEFLSPAGITQVELAARMGVPIQRISGGVSGRRGHRQSGHPAVARPGDHRGALVQPPDGCRPLGR